MSIVTQHCIVDISSNNNFVQIPAVQGDGDGTRFIEIELINNGEKVIPDANSKYFIIGTKPDNKTVWNECEVTSEGYIKTEITYQMTAAVGKGNYEIVEIPNKEIGTLKSFPFGINVTKASVDIENMTSTDQWKAFIGITKVAQLAAEQASSANQGIKEYADSAEASSKAAEESKNEAATSAQNAKTSEENVKASETKINEDIQSAKDSATAAKASEDNAKISETNAKTSETNAKASEDDVSEKSSHIDSLYEEIKTNASNADKSATAAKTSEENAKSSEDAANDYATNAKISETNAATSEANAATSATNAKNSEDNVSASITTVKSYVNGGTGTRDGEDKDNAEYYASQAALSAAQAAAANIGVSSFNGRSGNVMPTNGDYTADQVGTYTKNEIDEKIENAGKVKTVNQQNPDENGNITLVSVSSFNGRTGDVAPTNGDYTATQISYGNNSNVNDALNGKQKDLGINAIGTGLQIDSKGLLNTTTSVATSTTLGEVIVGDGINVSEDGTISAQKINARNGEGKGSLIVGDADNGTTATGLNSYAEGSFIIKNNYTEDNPGVAIDTSVYSSATAEGAHAEGNGTIASGTASHAEGSLSVASGRYSHTEGGYLISTNKDSNGQIISQTYYVTTASGYCDHAEGAGTTANGGRSHAEGNQTTSSGSGSHAEGAQTNALGVASHAEGYRTFADGTYEHVSGKYNKRQFEEYDSSKTYNVGDIVYVTHDNIYTCYKCITAVTTPESFDSSKWDVNNSNIGNYAEVIGNGTSNSNRSNAYTLDWNGNGWYKGKITVGFDPTNNMDVATKQYVDNKVHISSTVPTASDGKDGDIWIVYTQ